MAISLIFAVFLASSFAYANAGEVRSSAYLQSYQANLAAQGNGIISVYASIYGRTSLSKIGVYQIDVYESTDNGNTFPYYDSFFYYDHPTMMGSGRRYSQTALTFSGTAGNQYKAIVYCYGSDPDGDDTKAYYTSAIIAK